MIELTPGKILYIVAFAVILFNFIYQFYIRAKYKKETDNSKSSKKYYKDIYAVYRTKKYIVVSTLLLIFFIIIGFNTFHLDYGNLVLPLIVIVFIIIVLLNVFKNLQEYKYKK